MAGINRRYTVRRSEADVRRLLLDERFLEAFVDMQHGTDKEITVDHAERSTSKWTNNLEGELPSLVLRFVGRRAHLVLTLDLANAELGMEAKAKRRGDLKAEFKMIGEGPDQCVLTVDGTVYVSGAFGGLAESIVRDEVIVPVFEEDLVPLLESWQD